MKAGQIPSASKVTNNDDINRFFLNTGHRTVQSQRALQAHSNPWIGHTTFQDQGMFVFEFSPYENDLYWDDVGSLEEMLGLVKDLRRATAEIHCVSDADSDQEVVPFSTDQAIHNVLKGRHQAFTDHMTQFSMDYGNQVRNDYNLFVDAFRNHQFAGI